MRSSKPRWRSRLKRDCGGSICWRGARMRLSVVDQGHAPAEAALLEIIRKRSGHEPLGVVKTLLYRPDSSGGRFGSARSGNARPFGMESRRARTLRGVHLAPQPVSLLNGIPRRGRVVRTRRGGLGCRSHRLAISASPSEAGSHPRLPRELTLRPDELDSTDVEAARRAGVSDDALRDASTVCALFSMIVRLADSLGWRVPSSASLHARAPAMLGGGYRLDAVGLR